MKKLQYPSPTFAEDFRAAIRTREDFDIVVPATARKRLGIARLTRRMQGKLPDGAILPALIDFLLAVNLHVLIASAINSYECHVEVNEGVDILTLMVRPRIRTVH